MERKTKEYLAPALHCCTFCSNTAIMATSSQSNAPLIGEDPEGLEFIN